MIAMSILIRHLTNSNGKNSEREHMAYAILFLPLNASTFTYQSDSDIDVGLVCFLNFVLQLAKDLAIWNIGLTLT